MVRCFEDSDITHVEGKIAPLADIETIETELMLADLDSLEKRVDNSTKKAKGNDKDAKEQLDLVNRALVLLREGKPARFLERKPEEERAFGMLGLLTSKPVLYVCNVEEGSAADGNEFSQAVFEHAKKEGAVAVVISAKIESEIATLSREERAEFLDTLGLEEAGLDRLIRAGYRLLDLITYFTVGPKEARAWTINRGTKAPAAAGVIHTDFEKGFIRAETIAYADYVGARRRGRRARCRQAAAGRQGICRRRRRRHAFPVQHLERTPRRVRAAEVDQPGVADGRSHARMTSPHRALVADRAEMLVDAKHDQDEFRGDARKHDADHDAGDRGQQQDESAERADRHRGQAREDAGQCRTARSTPMTSQ